MDAPKNHFWQLNVILQDLNYDEVYRGLKTFTFRVKKQLSTR
jgi:hypothetical protein